MKVGNENIRDLPSIEYLFECFGYNEDTGVLYRKSRPSNHFKNEAIAKMVNTRFASNECTNKLSSHGYLTISLDGVSYQAHRVIWKMHTGEEPKFIDHINGDRRDNRISNLRSVDRGENAINRSLLKNNTTGIHGVSFCKRDHVFYAYIKKHGKRTTLGRSKDFFEVCCMRKSAELLFGFHENHGRKRKYGDVISNG